VRLINGKISFYPPKLSPVLRLAPQTAKTPTPASATTKTFEKCHIWRNIPILPLQRVIFQLKNNNNNKLKILKTKKTNFFFF
jgi:hypothetical protein